jgi:hypothetical protein
MDFIMLNLNKIFNLFQKYDKLYNDSIIQKKTYTRLLKFVTTKNKLPINDFDLNIGIDIDDEIKWKDTFKDIYIFQNFFMSIKQNRINFSTGKIYSKKK